MNQSTGFASPPQPNPWLVMAAVFGLFIGGGLAGIAIGNIVVADSETAIGLSGIMLPLGLILGLSAWVGVAILSIPIILARRLLALRQSTVQETKKPADSPDPIGKGSFVFVVVSTAICALIGVVCALLSGSGYPFVAIVPLYTGIGLLYGLLCWRLAWRGYLPFPDEL